MKRQLTNVKTCTTMDVYYKVSDVPDRPHYDKQYRPDALHVALRTNGTHGSVNITLDESGTYALLGESKPVYSVDIIGKRLKKDGVPGTLDVTEHLYNYGGYPDWVQEIINEILLSLA